MSGGVGQTYSDISLPKEQEKEAELKQSEKSETTQSSSRRGSFLSFRQLNAVALMIILSASGTVCLEDHAFVVFSIVYMYFLSRFAFPKLTPSAEPPVFDPQSKVLRVYVTVGAIVGLFLPILYVSEGIVEGDKEGIKAATPHVFLLASQVFLEGVAFSSQFSTPIRVFVPVCYNAMRMFTLMEWLSDEFSKLDVGNPWRLYAGRGLAICNTAFWGFNLLGFLLPVYLPRAFKMYYTHYKVKD